jgi:hypothetical protein
MDAGGALALQLHGAHVEAGPAGALVLLGLMVLVLALAGVVARLQR